MQETSQKRVLIVDDDPDALDYFADILNDIEFLDLNVDLAMNGLEASQYLLEGRYDVILTDFKMPLMDGLDLIEQTRLSESGNSNTPFIVISGKANDPEDFTQKALPENVAWLHKPFNEQVLHLSLREMLSEDDGVRYSQCLVPQ